MEIDKEKLIELCDQIKAKLIEKGKTGFIVKVAESNEELKESVSLDEAELEELEYKYYDEALDTDTRLAMYDCGGYYRELQMDGVVIENDTLYFYLTETYEDDNGIDDQETYKEDIDGFLDPRAWWMSGGGELEFRPKEILEFYLSMLSDEVSEFGFI